MGNSQNSAQDGTEARTTVAGNSNSNLVMMSGVAFTVAALLYLGVTTRNGVIEAEAARKKAVAMEEMVRQTPVFQIPTDGPNGQGVVMVPARARIGDDGSVIIERVRTQQAASDNQLGSATFAELPK